MTPSSAAGVGPQILDYILKTGPTWGWAGPGPDPFDGLARALFAHQVAHNVAYGRWIAGQGLGLKDVTSWRDVPPLPTDAFKVAHLATGPAEGADAVFLTSGTTQGDRGRHVVPDLRYYRAAMEAPFLRHLAPDGEGAVVLDLTPAADPASSLGFMCKELGPRMARAGSRAYQAAGALDFDEVWGDLDRAAAQGAPVLLLGTAFAWVHLLDAQPGRAVRLPAGSRLMETGGFKGRSREVSRAELRALLSERLGLHPAAIVGEYGMTELSSQLYEGAYRQATLGEASPPGYLAPPWVRLSVRDPQTLEALPDGEVGVVAVYDLANVGSVASIVTADLGRILPGGGLELRGRASGAELRGCSLQVEELLHGAGT